MSRIHRPRRLPISPMEQLDALEKYLIRQTCRKPYGVQTRAAEKLGISERVLRYKLRSTAFEKNVEH